MPLHGLEQDAVVAIHQSAELRGLHGLREHRVLVSVRRQARAEDELVRRADVADLASQLLRDLRRKIVSERGRQVLALAAGVAMLPQRGRGHGCPYLDDERADQRQPQPGRSEPVSRDDEIEDSSD